MVLFDELTRLVAVSPADGRLTGLVRRVCGLALSLPPLPAPVAVRDVESDTEAVVADFAEQFSTGVSAIDNDDRKLLIAALGRTAFDVVTQMYIADFVPRVSAGLKALGVGWPERPTAWDRNTDPTDAVFNRFVPTVAREFELDALTTELVRLYGAIQHNCRQCKSLRESSALDAGGSEALYDDLEHFETSPELTERHKAALRFVDALIWSPSRLAADVIDGVRTHFSQSEAVELTFDVMRNASNKVAVALGGDAPQVDGLRRYSIGSDGQTLFT
jgi:alkylhydroperoxidase family enzyme